MENFRADKVASLDSKAEEVMKKLTFVVRKVRPKYKYVNQKRTDQVIATEFELISLPAPDKKYEDYELEIITVEMPDTDIPEDNDVLGVGKRVRVADVLESSFYARSTGGNFANLVMKLEVSLVPAEDTQGKA